MFQKNLMKKKKKENKSQRGWSTSGIKDPSEQHDQDSPYELIETKAGGTGSTKFYTRSPALTL